MPSFFKERLLSIPILLTLLALAFDVPIWVSVSASIFTIWRFLIEKQIVGAVSSKLTGLLSFAMLAIVLMTEKTLMGLEPSSAFLFTLTALKILEYKDARDRAYIVCLGFILIATKSLFNIDVSLIFPSLIGVFCLWMSFIQGAPKLETEWKTSFTLKVFMMSLPLIIFLFFLFPRLSSPFGQISKPDDKATSGFSEDLNPGEIGEVTLSQKTAFRVQFKTSQKMEVKQLYWRGEVLDLSAGMEWKKSNRNQNWSQVKISKSLDRTPYSMILEPHQSRWIFPLDTPTSLQTQDIQLVPSETGVFKLPQVLETRIKLNGFSSFTDRIINDSDRNYLQRPPLTPKLRELLGQLKIDGPNPEDRAEQLFAFYELGGFKYTRQPGKLSGNHLEDFLINKRMGFCDHFAASFATLLRYYDVPSRVAIGYHGGELNEVSQFWTIKEADAHSWVEFLNSKNEWQRIDPTSAAAPLRIELGATDFFELPDELQTASLKDITDRLNKQKNASQLWNQLTSQFDSLNYEWTTFMLEFNMDQQREWMSQWGISPGILFAIGIFVLLMTSLIISWLQNRKKSSDLIIRNVDALFLWAEARGVHHDKEQPMSHFFSKLKKQYPNQFKEIEKVESDYHSIRFQKNQNSTQIKKSFSKHIQALFKNIKT